MAAIVQPRTAAVTEEAQQQSEFQRLLQQPMQVKPGYQDAAGYELLKMMASGYAHSSLVPEQYRKVIVRKGSSQNGWQETLTQNPQGLPNCMIALNMALRMNADPLMVMQNLYVVEGRPSWSAQYTIAAINNCGRFSPLRFEISEEGPEEEIEYETTEGYGKDKKTVSRKLRIRNRTCRAYVYEKATGERLQGSAVSMAMAVREGWYQKNGSKWKTMPEQMLMYRSAAFFGRLYAPDLLMGMPTADEVADGIAAEQQPDAMVLEVSPNPMLEAMRAVEREAQTAAVTSADPAEDVPPADMDPETGEIPPPAAVAQQAQPQTDAEIPPAPAVMPPEVDDLLTEIDDCATQADLAALGQRGAKLAKKYPEYKKDIAGAGLAKRAELEAREQQADIDTGFGGGE